VCVCVTKCYQVQQELSTPTVSRYRGADKSLARPGRTQARKHVRDARDFNDIDKRAVIKVFFLQGKAPEEIHAIMTETLACFLPGRAKDLSAPCIRSQTEKGSKKKAMTKGFSDV